MDKKLYDIVYNAITTQFGAGDHIEDGDREACAEQIVEDLEKAGYRQIIPLVDFVVSCSDLINVREKAYNDARKETAREILSDLLFNVSEDDYKNVVDLKGDIEHWIEEIAEEYGVEVDDNGGTKG